MTYSRQSRNLWVAFTVLFAAVAVASLAPVGPIVGIFPLWAVLVLAAMVATVVVGAGAVYTGWPDGGESA
jgi:uncharacterized metal-binding protein